MQINEIIMVKVKNGNKNIIKYKFVTEQLSFNNYFLQYLKETSKDINTSGTIIIKSNVSNKLDAYS